MRNHHQCLKKYTLNLEKQRRSVQNVFTEYHIILSKVQNLAQNNLKAIGSYILMFDGLKQTEIYRSYLLSYLKFKDQKPEGFLPNSRQLEMETKLKEIGRK